MKEPASRRAYDEPAWDATASYTGTSADLQGAIHDVVVDDYCEFNVKVFTTTTAPPTTFARRATVAIGTDSIFQGTAGAANRSRRAL